MLKGVWHEIFDLRFFSWISVPQAHKYSIGAVLNFFENSRRYSRINVYHRCQRHRRLILATDFQWSPVSLTPLNSFSPVTTTPVINLLPVTRTRTPWRWGAAKDRKKLKGINQRYLRPPKSATAADGVIWTAMKSCIHKHPTLLDQRLLRPSKLNNAVLVCSSFGGLRGLWSGRVRGLCAFSLLFQWQYRQPWPTSAAGDSFAESTDLCRQFVAGGKIYRRCQRHRR